MAAHPSSYQYIEGAAISAVEQEFNLKEVRCHPQGGWTIATRSHDSSIATYHGNFASASAAARWLAEQKAEAVKRFIHGRQMESHLMAQQRKREKEGMAPRQGDLDLSV